MRQRKNLIYFFVYLILVSAICIYSNDYYDLESQSLSKYFFNNLLDNSTNESPNIKNFERICSDLFPEGEPAAAVLIMKEGKVLFENYYGLTNLTNGTKIDMNTNFNIASNSKQFTAVGILQLVERGNISLDESLFTYFPEYKDPLWKKLKIRHLLSHTSGIPDARGYLNRSQKVYGDEKLALEYLTNLTYVNFEAGSAYEYINPTYVLMGRLIERITNKSFVDYIQENIFDPANMTNTAYIFQEKNACHAYEYERDEGDSEESGGDRPPGPHDWYEYDYGEENFFATRPDGGIYSNPRDFIKWEKALPSLLNQDLLKEAYTPKIKTYGSPWSDYQNRYGTYYGYGWFIEPEKKCIYHTGDNGGFKILAAKYLDKNAFVVVFAARADWDRYRFKTQIEEIFDLIPKITEKVNFILQMQKINNKLHIYSIANYPILKNETIFFKLNIYSLNSGRLLSQNESKEIGFNPLNDYTGNDNKIIVFESNEEFNENVGIILHNKNEENIKFILNENKNNLNTEKVKEEISKGEIDYNKISSDYIIHKYSIISSNEGCEFSLNLNENIAISNAKLLNLNFIEADNHSSKITSECILSADNKNKIQCKLNKNINNTYILEPFFYSDNSESILIFQNYNNEYFNLKCSKNNSQNDDDSSGGLSAGAIIGIVFGGVAVLIIIGLITYFIIKKKGNEEENKESGNISLGIKDTENNFK